MLILPPRLIIPSGPPSLVFNQGAVDATALTTYTFPGVSFGVGEGDREVFIVLCAGLTSARTVVSMTIGGENATLSPNVTGSSGSQFTVGWARVTQSSGPVVVVLSGAASNLQLACWSYYNRRTAGDYDTSFGSTSSASAATLTISTCVIPPGGFLLASIVLGSTATVAVSGGPTEVYEIGSLIKEFAQQGPVVAPVTPSIVWTWTGATTCRAAAWAFAG
jgi:hypothetical protein